MKTDRKSRKPNKGMKQFLAQGMKSLRKALAKAAGPTKRPDQWWHTPEAMRSMWLLRIHGKWKHHQGAQEKARRVRQMLMHKCINPETWVYL